MTNAVPVITVYGDIDPRAIEQLERCALAGDAPLAAICADGHVGYSQPIGGVIGYRDYISPSGVGYDIACGNKAVRTNIKYSEIKNNVPKIMDEIFARISFGVGRKNNEPADHEVFDKIKNAEFAPQRQLYDLAVKQLGTVGSGNHYVDLFRDEEDKVWIGVHFGSRGFGHKTATGFLALSQGKTFEDQGSEGEMDSPPVLFRIDSGLGEAYIQAMTLAGEYAYAGRDMVVNKVCEILGAETDYEVHNHHNFAWKETHQGEELWVVRKGCTPAFPGQEGFIGSTMGEPSVIVEGVENDEAQYLLNSTVHGAGRVLSRTKAAGKWKKVWQCGNRDCEYEIPVAQANTTPGKGMCPDHPGARPRKIRLRKGGEVDWAATLERLREERIVLKGGAADEAPAAYKRLNDVLMYHNRTIAVTHTLFPIGVAMAGSDTFDPYKD